MIISLRKVFRAQEQVKLDEKRNMWSTSCIEAVLFSFILFSTVAAVAAEDDFFAAPLARRKLPYYYNHSGSKSSSSSKPSRSKKKSSISRSKSGSSSSKSKKRSASKKMSSSSSSKKKPSKPSPSSSKSKKKPSPSSSADSKSKPRPPPSKSRPMHRPSKSKPMHRPSPSDSSGKGKGKGGKGKGGIGSGKGGKGKGKGSGGKGKGNDGIGDKDLNGFVNEGEMCGEDINGGCESDPPVFGDINFEQTIIGQFGAVLNPETELFDTDRDWFLFDIHRPACVQATLASIHPGIVTLFEGTCSGNDLVDVASGDTSGNPALYCFPEAGQYGVFVAPEFFDSTPCDGDSYSYYLAIDYIECGNCLIESQNSGCSDKKCKHRVCKKEDKSCCEDSWSAVCVELASQVCDCEEKDGKIIDEKEPCGEDINGGCFSNDNPRYSSIDFGQIILGEYGAELDPISETFNQDSDWYLFEADEPGTCVRATLESTNTGDVVLFQGSTFNSDTCTNNLVNVASGDNTGNAAVYCFEEAGEYGVFVAPRFNDDSPCQGDPSTYILAFEHLDKCGTCLMDNGSSGGCANKVCESTVCGLDASCCDDTWDGICAEKARLWCQCAGGEEPDVVEEGEECGEDINGGCFDSPPSYGSLELGQTLLGEYGEVWNPILDIYQYDTDWFLFDADEPNTCVQATLTSRKSGDVVLFEGSTNDSETCLDNLVNVASGDNSEAAVYCFQEAGQYGVFVAPTFQDETPCEGDPNTYVLTLAALECGTCFVPHGSPGCSDKMCRRKVCEYHESCCDDAWDESCVEIAKLWCDCVDDDNGSSSGGKGKGGSRSMSSGINSGKGKGASSSMSSHNDSGKGKGGSRTYSSDSGKGKGAYPSSRSKSSKSRKSSKSHHRSKGYYSKSSKSRKKRKGMRMRKRKGMKGRKWKWRKSSKRSKSHWSQW